LSSPQLPAGARAYLLKDPTDEDWTLAIRTVARGTPFRVPWIAVLNPETSLSYEHISF